MYVWIIHIYHKPSKYISFSSFSWVGSWSFSLVTFWCILDPLFGITEFMIILLSAVFPCITISIGIEIRNSIQLKSFLNFWHHSNILLNSGNTFLAKLLVYLKKNSFVLHARCSTWSVIVSTNELCFRSPSITWYIIITF